MSETPRTDAKASCKDFCESLIPMVTANFARQLERELNAAKAALSGRTVSCSNCNETAKPCAWKQDEDGNWDTKCGQFMCFEYAPPKEHGYKFCHGCGHPINFITFIESLV